MVLPYYSQKSLVPQGSRVGDDEDHCGQTDPSVKILGAWNLFLSKTSVSLSVKQESLNQPARRPHRLQPRQGAISLGTSVSFQNGLSEEGGPTLTAGGMSPWAEV